MSRPVSLAVFALFIPALAWADFRAGDRVVIGPDETISEDLYVAAREVRVLGTVRGDVLAAAGSVEVTGTVEGDVMVAAGSVTVGGEIGGSVRAAAGELRVPASVTEDLVAAAGQVRLESPGEVARDVTVAAGRVDLEAPIGGQLRAAAGELALSSRVGSDVFAHVGTLELGQNARIEGDLAYQTDRQPAVADGAVVVGQTQATQEPARGPLWFVVRWLRALVGLLALGLVAALLSPKFFARSVENLRARPLRTAGTGLLVLVGLPLVALLVTITGALVGGWWLGLFALAAYGVAILLCFPVIGTWLGRWLLARFGRSGARIGGALVLGLVLLTLLLRVPALGPILALAIILFGLGAMALAASGLRRSLPA
jgi:cytoskeletal protein CcmA (bactofilin family)